MGRFRQATEGQHLLDYIKNLRVKNVKNELWYMYSCVCVMQSLLCNCQTKLTYIRAYVYTRASHSMVHFCSNITSRACVIYGLKRCLVPHRINSDQDCPLNQTSDVVIGTRDDKRPLDGQLSCARAICVIAQVHCKFAHNLICGEVNLTANILIST